MDLAVTATPTAAQWLASMGEVERIERLSGYPVRSEPRLPSERSGHPICTGYVVAPATANTIAKLALGIADNQALTTTTEAIGAGYPVVIFPRVNAAHTRQPAWESHLANLRSMRNVHLIYGPDVWPLCEPRTAPPDRELPWSAIRDTLLQALAASTLYTASVNSTLPDDWWFLRDVATYLQVGESTVRAYIARGNFPPEDRRIGRMRMWRPDTIRAWAPTRTKPTRLQRAAEQRRAV